MKVNKKGERHISLRDRNLIDYVETASINKHMPMFQIAEELMNKGLTQTATKEPNGTQTMIIEKSHGYGEVIDALLLNGYRVDITPTAGKTGLNERLIIKFRKEK